MKTSYRVGGMTCGGCASAVTRAIQASCAGAEVTVDLDAGTIEVGGVADDAAIAGAVESAGFDFGGRVDAA